MPDISLTLPAVDRPATVVDTPHGRLEVPGRQMATKTVTVDPALIQQMIQAAREAALSAYAPYSRFRVGAAVIMADDPDARIITGANVENSSYGITSCGERSAIFQAVSAGYRRLRYLAVTTVDSLDGPLSGRSPCGTCRQVIREFTAQDSDRDHALIFIDSGDPDILAQVLDVERLLPYGFNFAPLAPQSGRHG